MPQTITKEVTVFDFNELSDKAKDKAIEKYAQMTLGDSYWAEPVIEGATEDGKKMGFDIDEINWSGFWSQGDGASWTGTVDLPTFIDSQIPDTHPLFARAQVYAMLVKDGWVGERVEIHRYGFYYSHSGTMRVGEIDDGALVSVMYDAHFGPEDNPTLQLDCPLKGADVRELAKGIDAEDFARSLIDEIAEKARDYADEVYRRLEEEYEYQVSYENFAELCYINGWQFEEDGELV